MSYDVFAEGMERFRSTTTPRPVVSIAPQPQPEDVTTNVGDLLPEDLANFSKSFLAFREQAGASGKLILSSRRSIEDAEGVTGYAIGVTDPGNPEAGQHRGLGMGIPGVYSLAYLTSPRNIFLCDDETVRFEDGKMVPKLSSSAVLIGVRRAKEVSWDIPDEYPDKPYIGRQGYKHTETRPMLARVPLDHVLFRYVDPNLVALIERRIQQT